MQAGRSGEKALKKDIGKSVIAEPPLSSASVQTLILWLKKSRDFGTKTSIIEELGKRKDPSAVPALARMLDEGFVIGECAAFALSEIADKAAKSALIEALGNKNSNVRRRVAEALGELRVMEALEKLKDIASNDEYYVVRCAARKAVEQIEGTLHPLEYPGHLQDGAQQ